MHQGELAGKLKGSEKQNRGEMRAAPSYPDDRRPIADDIIGGRPPINWSGITIEQYLCVRVLILAVIFLARSSWRNGYLSMIDH